MFLVSSCSSIAQPIEAMFYSRMKMYLEQHRQAMPQLQIRNQKFVLPTKVPLIWEVWRYNHISQEPLVNTLNASLSIKAANEESKRTTYKIYNEF